MYAWECPTSLIPEEIWDAIDLFWLCHTRVPGFENVTVQRTGYPKNGGALNQDNWTMWAFEVIESEFNSFVAAEKGEIRRQETQHAAQKKMKEKLG